MSTSTEQPEVLTNGDATLARDSREQFIPARRPLRRSAALDDYDALSWRLQPQLDAANGVAAIFGVVATATGAGSTTISANLAQRLVVQVDGPVLLVDANLYRPRAERLFGLKNNPGLAEVLVDDIPLVDAIQHIRHSGLDLLPAGRGGVFDQMGVQPTAFESLFNELRERYSAVVVDLPEASKLGLSLFMARECDGVLLVAEADRTRRGDAQGAAEQLKLDGVSLIGSILNRKRTYVPGWMERWL